PRLILLCVLGSPSAPISPSFFPSFFFHDTAPTQIYTLSLHDALPISSVPLPARRVLAVRLRRSGTGLAAAACRQHGPGRGAHGRSEEHTSELQSRENLVCRLLLEKKKQQHHTTAIDISQIGATESQY